MEIALVDGTRTLAAPGLRGTCLACGQEMVAKCGDLLVWHWAHKARLVCDPWWENEGPWHRSWKEQFPVEFHEHVHFADDGEKHVADVELPDGLVIELQHSPMSLEEMRSREAFYHRMIWIVDGAPFIDNITIFDPLPDPTLPFVEDLRFYGPHPHWRSSLRVQTMSYENLMFYRESKKKPGDTMVEMESGRTLRVDFKATHAGHFLFLWMKPREVWYQTTLPTYVDLGDGLLGRLMRYRPGVDQLWCLQIMTKGLLVRNLLNQAQRSRGSLGFSEFLPVK